MHPYKKQADDSHRTKRGNLGKQNNLDIPIMKSVGENSPKRLYSSSSSSQQLQKQSAADGMKRGGHVGKPRHHKVKIAMVAPAGDTANPPLPDPAMAAAGAGSSPVPAPPMAPPGAMPPAKRGGRMHRAEGGRVHPDEAEDKALVHKMVKSDCIKRKDGGAVMNTWQKAGAGSGEGRLEISKHTKA